MTGSMYASVAGLRTHMQKLTVIGNNVANVNTQGYKKQRTVFRDSIYSMYSSGTDGTNTIGGMNPSQLGYGSKIGSIDLNMSSASYNPGNPTDCAIVGDGFFLVGNKEVQNVIDPNNPDSFKSLTLTRVGDFHFGPDNYLVDGNGNVVYGFMNTGEGYKRDPNNPDKTIPDISDQLVPIRLPRWEKVTRTIETGEEDDNGDPITRTVETHEIRYAQVTGTGDEAGTVVQLHDAVPVRAEDADEDEETLAEYDFAILDSISIDAGTGAITGVVKDTSETITIGYLALGSVTNPNGVSHVGDSYYRCQEGAGDLRIFMLGNVNQDLGIKNINSYMAETGEGADPLPAGSEIVGAGGTKMMTGFLEGPNTDLAEEITELITTQRGYQANTRIITVTDSMLEELVNMKR